MTLELDAWIRAMRSQRRRVIAEIAHVSAGGSVPPGPDGQMRTLADLIAWEDELASNLRLVSQRGAD